MDNFEKLNGFRFPDENAAQATSEQATSEQATSEQAPAEQAFTNPESEVLSETEIQTSMRSVGSFGSTVYALPVGDDLSGKKIKKGRFKSVVAAALAVLVLGGAAGFGGAYLGNSFFDNNSNASLVQIPDSTAVTGEITDEVYLTATDTLAKNTSTKEMTPSELFEQVKDSVVGIKLYEETTLRGRTTDTTGSLVGSGFIFTTDGYVLTNYHVITDYKKIGVVVSKYDDSGETIEYEAEIVGKDSDTDLAILKITRSEAFKAAPIGDSSSLKVGQFVCPVGYPLDIGKSITYGVISGLNREVESGGYELSSIQIDAAVNMGNSGGPLFDMYGNVVGIVNKKLVYDNLVESMGFAITIDEAKPIINDLLAYGEITSRPIIGINTYALNEYTASAYGVDIKQGLLVQSINSKAPVAKSGLVVYDIITKVNGKEVASVADVQAITKNLKSGDTIDVTVVRYNDAGKKQEIVLTIELTTEKDLQ